MRSACTSIAETDQQINDDGNRDGMAKRNRQERTNAYALLRSSWPAGTVRRSLRPKNRSMIGISPCTPV